VATLASNVPTQTKLALGSRSIGIGKPVTLVATLTASLAGIVPAGTVTFLDGLTIIGTAPIDATGHATLALPALGAGSHNFLAAYAPNNGFLGSLSTRLPLRFGGNDGPRVIRIKRKAPKWDPHVMLITFDSSLDPTTATRLANYQLIAGECGKFGKGYDQPIPLTYATYNARTNTVTLHAKTTLDIDDPTKVLINGVKRGAITGLNGLRLDGKNNGHSGSNFAAIVIHDVLNIHPRPAAGLRAKTRAAHDRVGTN
jgi:hypothetical protein